MSQGGAQEQTSLSRIDSIMLEMPHIILVEPAVNDQCNYKDQEKKANTTDILFDSLLNKLINFPGQPTVVISVELFWLAKNSQSGTNNHCCGATLKR